MDKIRFGIVGSGWRTEFFLRIARELPERFAVTGVVTRKPERAKALHDLFGVRAVATLEELWQPLAPDFIVTSVPRAVNLEIISRIARQGIAILSETPPAGTLEELHRLHALSTLGAKIQVAEQYFLQPQHAARLAFIATGKLGALSHANVSIAHGYHGISLMRRFLGIGYENCTIRAQNFKSKIIESRNRFKHPPEERLADCNQIIASLDFGDKLALFDFTGEQYFSYMRRQRLTLRGTRGEIVNDEATFLVDQTTPVRVEFTRHFAGGPSNLEGHYLKGIQAGESWVYRNRLAPARLMDDEIAIAECLLGMAHYVRTGEDFYSLAEACQDTYVDLMMQEAAKTGETVRTETQAWAQAK